MNTDNPFKVTTNGSGKFRIAAHGVPIAFFTTDDPSTLDFDAVALDLLGEAIDAALLREEILSLASLAVEAIPRTCSACHLPVKPQPGADGRRYLHVVSTASDPTPRLLCDACTQVAEVMRRRPRRTATHSHPLDA